MSTGMVDTFHTSLHDQLASVHRKPIPLPGAATRTQLQPPQQQSSHIRSRTSSSSIFPHITTTTSHSTAPIITTTTTTPHSQRRTPSIATTSSASTAPSGQHPNHTMNLARSNSNLSRTPSTRSGNSPTSYVSLMRKQKATVWCDRAQHEDPRILEARRQAKMRAVKEVVGGSQPRTSVSGSSMNSSVRAKIGRHHGVPKAMPYAPANMSGTGVPMRLSATEVDEGLSDDDSNYQAGPYHHRTGSGRSSLGSQGKRMSFAPQNGRYSTSSTPPSAQSQSPSEHLIEEETPVPRHNSATHDYFGNKMSNTLSRGSSGSSGERNFGGLGDMPEHTARTQDTDGKTTDELRRRGSVDDRSMTMSGNVRLFVANPDLSD